MISGLALGLFTANLPVGILRKFLFRRQWWFFLATVLIVLSCWGLALKQF
jgi:hypothetical protein